MKQRISTVVYLRERVCRSVVRLGCVAIFVVSGIADFENAALAQTAELPKSVGRETQKPEVPKETLSISILDAESGKPVPGAKVIFPFSTNIRYNGPVPFKIADERGHVVLPKGADTRMGFGVSHPEYAPIAVTWNWSAPPEITKRPEVPNEYTVRLKRGVEIGGTVVDENGKPVPKVRVEIDATTRPTRDTEVMTALEYPFYQTSLSNSAPVTDENGRWSCSHFPAEIELLKVDCIRPDRSRVQFHTEKLPWYSSLGGSLVKKSDVFARSAVFTLPRGVTVRGIVVDREGKPLAGITLRETDKRQPPMPLAEIVTAEDGRFELTNRDPHQIQVTATGPGLAINATIIDIVPGMPDVRIQMVPAVPLRVRVVDEEGQPLSKVQMSSALDVGWKGASDLEGRILWNDPPSSPATYYLHAEGYGAVRKRLSPGEPEQIVKIRKGETPSVPVMVRAYSAEDKPVASFTVSVIAGWHGNENSAVFLGEGKEGIYTGAVPFDRTGGWNFQLKIEAPRFDSFITEKLGVDAEVEVKAGLHKSGPVEGIVLLPNGKPATGAKLLIPDPSDSSPYFWLRFVGANQTPVSESDHVRTVLVDSAGRFSLPSTSTDHGIVVIHAEGFADMMLSQLKKTPEARLQAWGRLEGTYLLNSKPREKVRLMVRPKDRSKYSIYLSDSAETNKDGRFHFEKLPPGEYTLYRATPSRRGSSRTHPIAVKVEPGETTDISHACTGRTVTGRGRLDVPYVQVDWMEDVVLQTLTRRSKVDRLDSPVSEDYVLFEDYQKAFERWKTGLREGSYDTYGAEFQGDGSFRVEGLPEGVYDLEFSVAKTPPDNRGAAKTIGTLKREIVIPPGNGDDPFNVGILQIPIQDETIPRTPNTTLSARTFNGKPLELTQYRGKFVLLTFWASWAKPSAEELTQLSEVSEAFSAHPHISMIGVALVDKPGTVPQVPEVTGLKWVHTLLEGRDKTTTTEAWSVDSLPVTFLVNPEGWIIARDIKPDRLRALMEQSLQDAK